jgi:hypothetical protein
MRLLFVILAFQATALVLSQPLMSSNREDVEEMEDTI